MWGWSLETADCFGLLDDFYAAGFRQVDAATNYPINRNPEDFRAAEQILLAWIRAHGVSDLEVIMKVGSINNMRSPEHNLNKSFLLLNLDDYMHRFGNNLHTFMIHWDNRAEEAQIRKTLEALAQAAAMGLRPGLSGIQHPEVYGQLNQHFGLNFRIEVKHNVLQSDIDRYIDFHDAPRFLAYGLNAGGVKLDPKGYTPDSTFVLRGNTTGTAHALLKVKKRISVWTDWDLPEAIHSFNQLGMINAFHYPLIGGLILGPSHRRQLEENIHFFRILERYPVYYRIYQDLQSLTTLR